MGRLTVVVGGQAGSEGKGAVTGWLAKHRDYRWSVRVGGPNAGHSVVDRRGRKFALRQIPVAAAVSSRTQLVIAAGSEVDLEVLKDEIAQLEEAGHPVRQRLLIDGEATVLEREHAETEAEISTGTTGKGIGAARAARALRQARRMKDMPGLDLYVVDTQAVLRDVVRRGQSLLLEGTQGYVLGSHAGEYPYCASGDCRAIDFMAACGLPPMDAEVWLVLRTYPIRIAGDSGPMAEETSWDAVGVPPEFTTVTKKVRRVGEWDWDWARRSVEANRPAGPFALAITFADYWWPALAGHDGPLDRRRLPVGAEAKLTEIETKLDAQVALLGTGPDTQLRLRGGRG